MLKADLDKPRSDGPHLKTQGEIESAISEGIGHFEQEYMGRGPKNVHAYLIGDLVVVRLEGVLTAAEQHLVKTLPSEKGRDLLKQVRSHLIETARPKLAALLEGITGTQLVSLHNDISTVTGEEVVLFTLSSPVIFTNRLPLKCRRIVQTTGLQASS